jgi:hypothetical protein
MGTTFALLLITRQFPGAKKGWWANHVINHVIDVEQARRFSYAVNKHLQSR